MNTTREEVILKSYGLLPSDVLKALTKLRKSVVATAPYINHRKVYLSHNFGICFNLSSLLDSASSGAYTWVDTNSYGWPAHRTGNKFDPFPVKHTKGYGLWEGPNLHARLSLIDWLIGVAENHVEILNSSQGVK